MQEIKMELIEPTLNERNMMFREMRRKRQLLPPEESDTGAHDRRYACPSWR